jgi:hypothetical protein
VDPLSDGAGCLVSEQCKGGGCLGSCYTKSSRKLDDPCILGTLDHCATGLACLPTPSPTCVKLNLGQGIPCFDTLQCASGLTCRAGTTLGLTNPIKQCLKSNLADGAGCTNDSECAAQHVCSFTLTQGSICACNGDATCASGQYCDYACQAKKANGGACSGANQCTSGACAGGICYGRFTQALGASCVANDHCASNSCDGGVCRCDGDNDCTSVQHCDNKLCKAAVAESAACASNRWCTSPTPCVSTGDLTLPLACITSGSKAVGQACVTDVQCTSGKCPGASLLGKTCKCVTASDCGSGKWCDRGIVDFGYGDCKAKKTDFSDCGANIECTGGSCVQSGLTKKCITAGIRTSGQSCVNTTHCASGLLCDGTCYAPGSRTIGQSCINNNHCGSAFCLLGTCRCDGDSDCGTGKFCDLVAGSCKSKLIGGELCGLVDNVCASNKCSWGFCACFSQAGCPSSKYCEDQYCSTKKSSGSGCSSNVQCASGSCRSVATVCVFGACLFEDKCK